MYIKATLKNEKIIEKYFFLNTFSRKLEIFSVNQKFIL